MLDLVKCVCNLFSDGNNEIIEEYYPLVKKNDQLDFDSLLQQARKLTEEKKKKAL